MQQPWFQLVGPTHSVQLFGIRLLGIDAQNGRKLLFTLVFFALLYCISKALRAIAHADYNNKEGHQLTF